VGALYSRNATGLVREVPLLDHLIFNFTSSTPLVSGLVVISFVVAAYPRANLPAAILISAILALFVWTCVALLTATLPKVGGDYVFNTRLINPAVGFAFNLGVVIISPISAGLLAGFMATLGLNPALSAIATITGSTSVQNAADFFAPTNHIGVLITGTLGVVLVSVLSATGTKILIRTMTWFIGIFAVGMVVELVILLFTDNSTFVATYNHLAGAGAYEKVVAAGQAGGLYPTNGYDVGNTIGAVWFGFTVTMFMWWGTYLSGEVRRAGQRQRMLGSMIGAGALQTVILLIAWFLLIRTVGENFFISATAGNLKIGQASFPFFSALAAPNGFFVVVLSIVFTLWVIPGININMAVVQRGIFVYSFEGLLPRRLSEVNSRTHTPLLAIALTAVLSEMGVVLYAYWAGLSTLVTVTALFPFLMLIVLGIGAFLMPRRRPDIYRGSPADWKLMGIPVLPVVGVLTSVVAIIGLILAFAFGSQSGLKGNEGLTAGICVTVIAAAFIWWFAARAVRRRQGVNLDLLYRAIPPD
jgi:amino acid transporter